MRHADAQDGERRRVVRRVLDAIGEDRKAVAVRGRACATAARLRLRTWGDVAGRSGRVLGRLDRGRGHVGREPAGDLRQRLRVAHDVPDVRERDAGQGEQRVADGHREVRVAHQAEGLAERDGLGGTRDGSGRRVADRDHGRRAVTRRRGADGRLERRDAVRLSVRAEAGAGGGVGVGPRPALVGDGHLTRRWTRNLRQAPAPSIGQDILLDIMVLIGTLAGISGHPRPFSVAIP